MIGVIDAPKESARLLKAGKFKRSQDTGCPSEEEKYAIFSLHNSYRNVMHFSIPYIYLNVWVTSILKTTIKATIQQCIFGMKLKC